MSDPVSSVLGYALDGLALRQRTIANNLANLDTPQFRATAVDFESSLASVLGTARGASGEQLAGRLTGAAPATAPTNTPVGENGNNVDFRKETLAAMQSQFQYQMMSRAVSDRFDLVRTVAQAT
ncbi:MAG: flagellar basal body rod protein FlgB [Nocardioides sp.]|nr:flagellar basal body rod protein FlgB [Nocardioides sp.]